MMYIRPIAATDFESFMALAEKTGIGLTSLPRDAELLQKRIDASVASFAGKAAKADEIFVFVLVDSHSGTVAGTCAIAAAVGLSQAWYSYRVGLVVHASQELGIFTQTPTLFLSNDHTGQSELCSLFLAPDYRGGKNGSLLSKSRFLFLAQFQSLFSAKIIAEMRGVSDANGRSPFWEGLGRHFFAMDFAEADYLTGIGKKSFVAELMPKYPLYSSFLTPEAQAVIGKTHELTRPALAMLEDEGFRYEGHVDIFDAGPTVECKIGDIGAVAESHLYRVEIAPAEGAVARPTWLMSNLAFADFRAMLVRGGPVGDVFAMDSETAAQLHVRPGDSVRAVPLSTKDRQRLNPGG
ncbi:MAG: arginine N-succinyltransferase [Betaproteobacteria bacterium]|nr:arginine N-succinyltransferase [Betaproteobacteria bacterium]